MSNEDDFILVNLVIGIFIVLGILIGLYLLMPKFVELAYNLSDYVLKVIN